MTFQILSDHVLVQLDVSENKTPEGIYVPKFDTFSSDDGRQKTRISDNIFDTTGTVIQLGLEYKGTLKEGDRVIVSTPSASKYYFNYENLTHYTGLIKIPESLIDAKIIQN